MDDNLQEYHEGYRGSEVIFINAIQLGAASAVAIVAALFGMGL